MHGRTALLLFVISVLFMFLFQLEARLFSYVYLFHEGILLIQSILLGGGLLLLLRYAAPKHLVLGVETYLPVYIVGALVVQQFVFFAFNSFTLDLLTLSFLFGLIFVEITRYIELEARYFYGIELLGSFVGVLLYALGVVFFLEEKLLILALLGFTLYAFGRLVNTRKLVPITLGLLILLGGYSHTLLTSTLPTLVQCSEKSNAYGYKSACLNDSAGVKPTASFSHLKGRTDVFVQTDLYGNQFLEVKNSGYRVSAANLEKNRSEAWFELLEHRIPKLAYPENAAVLSIGAGAGSYVQALQSYIDEPSITAVEIDATVQDIYRSGRFSEFLPDRSSYTVVYNEGRRFVTLSDATYDVLTVSVESINSNFAKYVDERTGLLYTKEALATYIDRINDDGYLVLEQYYPAQEGGDAMAVKFLSTLHAASGEDIHTFREHLYMYTWAFNPSPYAQRFIAAVYKPAGFTQEDRQVLSGWITDLENFEGNPHRITTVHAPDGFPSATTYTPYFDELERRSITEEANVALVTDDRPFRHLVTTLPFPQFSYALFLTFFAGFLFVFGLLKRGGAWPGNQAVAFAALFGVLTFGLQYLLFYKTAAFLNTNLIFFSIFLLVPLLLSSIGGFFSTALSHRRRMVGVMLFVLSGAVLVLTPAFGVHPLLLFLLIGVVFLVSGFLFPLILHAVSGQAKRSVCYGVNIAAGGFSLLIMITLHATVGWSVAFSGVLVLTMVSAFYISRQV